MRRLELFALPAMLVVPADSGAARDVGRRLAAVQREIDHQRWRTLTCRAEARQHRVVSSRRFGYDIAADRRRHRRDELAIERDACRIERRRQPIERRTRLRLARPNWNDGARRRQRRKVLLRCERCQCRDCALKCFRCAMEPSTCHNQLTRITRDPGVTGESRASAACVSRWRPLFVGLVAAGRTRDEILREYPYLEAEDIAEALSYTAWRAEEVDVPLRRP